MSARGNCERMQEARAPALLAYERARELLG